MATLLELEPSSYNFYESPTRFKKSYLPLPLAKRIAAVLADHGVDQEKVLALAGLNEQAPLDLSAGEEQMLDRFRQLDPDQRGLLLQLADAMHQAPGAPSGSATVHTPQKSYSSDTRAAR